MAQATADPAREVTLYFRINRDGAFTFSCVDSDGSAFALADYTIVANFKRQPGDSTNFLQLTSGSGITKNASSFVLTMSKANAAKFREQTFYVEIVRTLSGLEKNWIAGSAIFHNGKFDGVSSTAATLTINDGDQVISLSINDGIGIDAASQAQVNAGTATGVYVNPSTLQDKDDDAVALVDGATIAITGPKHTLATAVGRTFTISHTGDSGVIEITLSATSATMTFPAAWRGISEGTSSGDNTVGLSGTSGDIYVLAWIKIGSNYTVASKNRNR